MAEEAAHSTSDATGDIVLETAHLVDIVWDKLLGWIEGFIAMLPNLAVALLVILAFALLARYAERLVQASAERASVNAQVASLAGVSTRIGLFGLGIFLALGLLDLQKTAMSLLAGVGVVGLALGFAFQDIASNFMSGVIMATRRPFEIGDLVESGGTMGFVDRLTLRATFIRNFDGQFVILPNKDVLQSPLINYSRRGRRRVRVPVGVAYDTDLERAREVAREAIVDVPGLDPEQGAQAVFSGFGGSSIDLDVYFWLDLSLEDADYLQARSEGVIAIKKAFDEADIEIPFPIRTLSWPEALRIRRRDDEQESSS